MSSDSIESTVPADRRRVLIAGNPFSGRRENRDVVARFILALRRRGLDPITVWDPEERSEWLADAARMAEYRCVVAAGGDGTLLDLINQRPTVPVATLPLGNKNLFAREFGFTRDVDRVAKAIEAGRTRSIDLGAAGDRRFSLVLSAGFDAEVVRRLDTWRRESKSLKRVDDISYVRHVLAALQTYPYGRVTLDADGERASGIQAFVFNLPQYGLPFPVMPKAKGDDGLLDWLVLERPGFLSQVEYWVSIATQSHLNRSDVHFGRARRIRLTAENPLPVQIDGDPFGSTPVNVESLPGALSVIVV